MPEVVFSILVPQLNANDDTVDFLGWKVENGSHVSKDQVICEVETMKSLVEITAQQEGILYQMISSQSIAKVGECLGLIGSDQNAIKAYLSKSQADKQALGDNEKIKITAKARELAIQHGIRLDQIGGIEVKGTIKVSDVTRYLSQHGQQSDPKKQQHYDDEIKGDNKEMSPDMSNRVVNEGDLPRHKLFMAQKLRHSFRNKLLTTIDTEIDLRAVKKYIQSCKSKGQLTSFLHIVMYALGQTLSRFPGFTKFQFNNRLFRYRDIDVAFIVKTFDGLLYAPVVRRLDKLDIRQIAEECYSITLRANRRQLKPEEMEGACFSVSCIPHNAISRFVALMDQFQSAILAISGKYNVLELHASKVIQIPKLSLTLTYDHTIIDGWDSAVFLEHLNKEINQAVLGG